MKNLVIPIAVLSAVGMMIFPLPSFLLDILLAANIAFSIALLVNSLYVRDVNSFSALPALLLLATLFRLSLNISTTRQLLSHGTAPEIITAFGNFVVHGNIAVGIVIFLILSIVQFLVIAKGAERVAEVSARFTLDAMPGKQMAIDADMRAGFISAYEAKEKRLELQRESKLYGALDGAMKFVKGDAIAGFLITAVNITAGILIGISYHDLSLAESVSRFTLFTVGDGLVSQIPAILVSVAAGIVVTQVSDKDGAFLGSSVLSQLGREPQAVFIVSGLLLLLSFAPGLPSSPFVFGAMFLFVVSLVKAQQLKLLAKQASENSFVPKRYSGFVLRMGGEGMKLLSAGNNISAQALRMKNLFFEKWGIVLPDISFDLDQSRADSSIDLYLDNRFLLELEKPQVVGAFGNKVIEAINLHSLSNKEGFLDDTHTRKLFEIYSAEAEDLINELIPEVITVTELTGLLKELISDGIPIKDFRLILQAVAEHSFCAGNPNRTLKQFCGLYLGANIDRLSYVRIKLKHQIADMLKEQGFESCWLLNVEADSILAEAINQDGIELVQLAQKMNVYLKELAEHSSSRQVLIASSCSTRRFLSDLIEESGLKFKVVASQELDSSFDIKIEGEFGSMEVDSYGGFAVADVEQRVVM